MGGTFFCGFPKVIVLSRSRVAFMDPGILVESVADILFFCKVQILYVYLSLLFYYYYYYFGAEPDLNVLVSISFFFKNVFNVESQT